jgi:hypothetical protein
MESIFVSSAPTPTLSISFMKKLRKAFGIYRGSLPALPTAVCRRDDLMCSRPPELLPGGAVRSRSPQSPSLQVHVRIPLAGRALSGIPRLSLITSKAPRSPIHHVSEPLASPKFRPSLRRQSANFKGRLLPSNLLIMNPLKLVPTIIRSVAFFSIIFLHG